jgi:hypothetical protein
LLASIRFDSTDPAALPDAARRRFARAVPLILPLPFLPIAPDATPSPILAGSRGAACLPTHFRSSAWRVRPREMARQNPPVGVSSKK